MSTNQIKEVKSVDSENFDYLLADSNIRIESVFKSRNHDPFEPNIPLTTEPITSTVSAATFDNDVVAYKPSVQKTKGSTKFSFRIDSNDYSIFDLRDAEFNIQIQYAYQDAGAAGKFPINHPSFGNQPLLSLFEWIELYIDDRCVGRNVIPGMNSNANYALRYPHCKSLEKNYEINGYISTDASKYSDFKIATDQPAASIADFDNQSITLQVFTNHATRGNATKALYTGFITQRIKLSDLFFFIKTLPPLYNHKVEVKFQRSAHNYLICNTNTLTGVKAECIGINKFNLRLDVYTVSDQLMASLKSAYATPVETLVTVEKQQLVDFMTVPSSGSGTSFNINLETAYKNKLLTLCIPRTNDFVNQYNKCSDRYTDTNYTSVAGKMIDNNLSKNHYDALKAPANSYTYGGIRSLTVQTLNGVKLYQFQPEIEGVIEGPKAAFRMDKPETQLNFVSDNTNVKIANYEDVYKQYVKARKHFWEEENEALDFDTFMKEYCVYCIDLSPFKLSPNENIMINIQYSEWKSTYNPYYENNTNAEGYRNLSTRILCNLYYDKVLKIGNGVFELKDAFDVKTESETVNMA
jgi:hypothetical protein